VFAIAFSFFVSSSTNASYQEESETKLGPEQKSFTFLKITIPEELDDFYDTEHPEPEPKYTAESVLGAQELKSVLIQAGFSGEALRQAWGTAMKESSGRPMAHNDNPKTGDNSYGLFQINMIGSLGPARLEKYGLSSYEDLFDPATNAEIAYRISSGGTNWGPWHGIGERTKHFMSQFPG
jgi:hypothetical protein